MAKKELKFGQGLDSTDIKLISQIKHMIKNVPEDELTKLLLSEPDFTRTLKDYYEMVNFKMGKELESDYLDV